MSDDEPIREFVVTQRQQVVGDDDIEHLEQVIAKLRSGEATAYALAVVGLPIFVHSTHISTTCRSERMNLLGQLDLLKYRLLRMEYESYTEGS